VPSAIDPGKHQIARDGDTVIVRQTVRLVGMGRIEIERRISPRMSSDAAGCHGESSVAAYRHEIDMRCEDDSLVAVPWIVAQVEPGGQAIIPTDADAVATAMFGVPPEAVLRETSGAVRMPIDCRGLYKIAVPAAASFGTLAYSLPSETGRAFQAYRFSHDRAGRYYDEPADIPNVDGFSTFVFQDDGSLGRYGELEFVGQDLGVDADGWRHGHLVVDVFTCIGADADVQRMAMRLLSQAEQ
jgi:hypothetical protein